MSLRPEDWLRTKDLFDRARARTPALGHTYAVSGRPVEARKIIEELSRPDAAGGEGAAAFIALVYAGLGEKDKPSSGSSGRIAIARGQFVT